MCFFSSCPSHPPPQPPTSISLTLPKTLLSPLSLSPIRPVISLHPAHRTGAVTCQFGPMTLVPVCFCLSDNICCPLLHRAAIKIQHVNSGRCYKSSPQTSDILNLLIQQETKSFLAKWNRRNKGKARNPCFMQQLFKDVSLIPLYSSLPSRKESI